MLSIVKLRILILCVVFPCDIMLSVIMLSFVCVDCHYTRYTECHQAEYRDAECLQVEYRNAECHFTETFC